MNTTFWKTVTWDIARAGGFTAYALLALAVIVGLALSTQLQSPSRWPRLINSELHNFLTLLSTIFLVVHVMAVWIDPFTHFGWNAIFIPFASDYRPVWMALGIVALYLGIAIGISTWLRPHIGYKWWRKLHVLTLGIFVLATIHGLGTGSDTQTGWALGIYLISSILVGSLLCRRIVALKGKRKHAPVQTIQKVTKSSQPRREQGTEVSINALPEDQAEMTLEQLLAIINQMADVDPNDERYQNNADGLAAFDQEHNGLLTP
jgi:predicted ferric reductase